MLFYSVRLFESCEEIDQIVLVTGTDDIKRCNEELSRCKKTRIVSGGDERYDSVRLGLEALGSDVKFVLVHDGARPFVTEDLVHRVMDGAFIYGAAVPVISPKDTIRSCESTFKREELSCVQTPQGFLLELLVRAYDNAKEKGFVGTDDASYVDELGVFVKQVTGDERNKKMTTVLDMPVEYKVGIGYDVHRLIEGRPLILGGVSIPWNKGLLGHSDADVLLHAIMDGLLGACGLGDIGEHFPDHDPAYKGVSSVALLKKICGLLGDMGCEITHIDGIIMAEKPKLFPYKEAIKSNIANIIGLSERTINIKATTMETMGFIGRGEGIAAQAVCTIKK